MLGSCIDEVDLKRDHAGQDDALLMHRRRGWRGWFVVLRLLVVASGEKPDLHVRSRSRLPAEIRTHTVLRLSEESRGALDEVGAGEWTCSSTPWSRRASAGPGPPRASGRSTPRRLDRVHTQLEVARPRLPALPRRAPDKVVGLPVKLHASSLSIVFCSPALISC